MKQIKQNKILDRNLVLQEVVELHDHKWSALNIVVTQRLKKLMAGVADPESVRRDHEARQRQKEHAKQAKEEAQRLRQKEKQRWAHKQEQK